MTTANVPAEGLFDTITGLPVHPLVVHFAVVLLPLAALGLIVLVLVPRWRRTFGWLVIAGLFVGTGAAFVAKESGEALAARVGEPERHASLGDILPLVAGLLFVVALVWFLLDRKRSAADAPANAGLTILGIAGVVLALAATGLTIAVGHSGAEAAWSGRITDTSDSASTGSAAGTATGGTGGAGSGTTYTLADVQAHNTPQDCWTTINGTVYDVTAWIDRHPGGRGPIEQLCGTDGTSAFTGQHGSQRRPNNELDTFAIGTLSTPQAKPAAFLSVPAAKAYTRAQVRKHNSPSDCWTIIGKGVYNVTSWINRHPGGASRIIALCGRDGTQAFNAQHGGQSTPARYLASFRIGRLATTTRT